MREAGPSRWARILARPQDWAVHVDRDGIAMRVGERVIRRSIAPVDLAFETRGLWHEIVVPETGENLRGLSRRDRDELERAIGASVLERMCVDWLGAFGRAVIAEAEAGRWIPERFVAEWDGIRAAVVAGKAPEFARLVAEARRGGLDDVGRDAVLAVDAQGSVREAVAAENERTFARLKKAEREFFRSIEALPLTDEQQRAVVAFDDRVLLVAAAGSGKTSTMIAKAAWAVHRGIADPDRILMLAFNQAAAGELQERADDRFERAGIPAGVEAQTFHAFGLRVITEATGSRPEVAEMDDEVLGDVDGFDRELVRTAVAHARAGRLTKTELWRRAKEAEDPDRARAFAGVVIRVRDAWDAHLKATGSVDFEEMLARAADLIERGRWASPYRVVLVDEFQDASRSRARLVAALQGDDTFLTAVGDDWQSIYRFAGSDLTAMTRFDETFGRAETLRLTRTFRGGRELARIAGCFVQRNPGQLRKSVRSQNSHPDPVSLVRTDDPRAAVAERLAEIARAGERRSVVVIGRFRRDERIVPAQMPENLDVSFRTAHAAKGLEADHAIIASDGFGAGRGDDPLLSLVLPEADPFPLAEERRLFYVALTRARRDVTLVAGASPSPFVDELVADGAVSDDRAMVAS